ncbi:NUDIX hydrolase [Siccirubricoccus sp. KC 17139]|uniref:NUDIX hydrolase n=1 Tax=Siccirubricoccus soli TaxID=2899147 RepID=A0ABT1D127_9PROT|nr:NUDIX hydrolase [Siccirubricoccus soli]MCO6415587.1 NUDIX hydrolase [Siccirubricoccus soli]MCP2681719.1 NUDIX hydrolase [Siccirubricoccus soli]
MTDDAPTRPEAPTDDNPGGTAEIRHAANRAVHPRNAASLILWRQGAKGVEVLMGIRHARHRFMPNVMVFPGGRVDREDYRAKSLDELPGFTRICLERAAPPSLARAIGIAAARELHEETGLVLGRMEGHTLLPTLGVIDYLCRAVTPPNRFMRFNARFLIAPAEAAHGAIRGSGELEELRFFTIEETRHHKVATITAKVLAEFSAWLAASPAEREARQLICFRGMDGRLPEGPARVRKSAAV